MSTPRFVRYFVAVVLVTGALFYVSPGASHPAAAGVEPVQQGRSAGGRQSQPGPVFTRRLDRCAVRGPSDDVQALIEAAANQGKPGSGPVTIPVYWHIITTSGGGGDVSGLVADQMQVLHDAFAGSGFSFDVKSVAVVANAAWFLAEAGSEQEVAMKAALRAGGPESLNIYTTNGDVYLGWADVPLLLQIRSELRRRGALFRDAAGYRLRVPVCDR